MPKTPEFHFALLEYFANFLAEQKLHNQDYQNACTDTNHLFDACKTTLTETQTTTFMDYTETAAYKSTCEWQMLYELGYKDCIVLLKTIGIL